MVLSPWKTIYLFPSHIICVLFMHNICVWGATSMGYCNSSNGSSFSAAQVRALPHVNTQLPLQREEWSIGMAYVVAPVLDLCRALHADQCAGEQGLCTWSLTCAAASNQSLTNSLLVSLGFLTLVSVSKADHFLAGGLRTAFSLGLLFSLSHVIQQSLNTMWAC